MQASNEVVGWRLDDRVARLRIDRPEKRNALAGAHWAAIERCLGEIHAKRPCDMTSAAPGATGSRSCLAV